VGTGKKVYARMDGSAMALFDAETFKPVVMLLERVDEDKKEKEKGKEKGGEVSAEGERVRRFYGIGEKGDIFHVAAVFKGESGGVMSRLQGRYGPSCPSKCIPIEQIPLLPGETLKGRGMFGKMTDVIKAGTEIFAAWRPEHQQKMLKVQFTEQQVKQLASTISDPTKVNWKPYQFLHAPVNR
jgi:hypothetical protein